VRAPVVVRAAGEGFFKEIAMHDIINPKKFKHLPSLWNVSPLERGPASNH